MNASVLIFVLGTAFLAAVAALPTSELLQDQQYSTKLNEEESAPVAVEPVRTEESEGRFRRATCDLLSVSTPWGSLNHSACAAHCLALRKGYKGGRCRSGVCHCRK